MALDNPSYFTVASGSAEPNSKKSNYSSRSQELRDIHRSISWNSAGSNQDLLIMGEPRWSDIAPELSSKPAEPPRRANSLKSTKSGVVYSALAASEEAAGAAAAAFSDASDDEEVFLKEDSARYYNLSAMAGSRRHSISAFASRERSISVASSSSKSFKEDFPQALAQPTADIASKVGSLDDHSLRHGSYPRKRCSRCPRATAKRSTDMDDILIVSVKESAAARLWVEYFSSYFEQISKDYQRKPYKVHHLGIEDVIEANGDVRLLAEKTSGVKLQLIILCPTFLEQISKNLQATAGLSKILLADRILALQLGTTDEDVTDIHKTALCSFSQWQRRAVGQDQDANFTTEFVTTAMAIFTKVWKHQGVMAAEENSQFAVTPKKIRQGQTSVLILLTYPLQKEDIVKITVAKNDEFTEIKTVKRRNPYTLKISIPEKFLEVSAIVNVLVEKNGSFIGKRPIKCESRLRELEQILRSSNNPVEFMCQTLGFSPHDTEQLDNWMVHTFQRNVPPDFNLFTNGDVFSCNKHVCEEFPTLLHFSARFGLEKLTAQLLDCPGGDMACEIRNVNDVGPADIAEQAGHKELAQMLRGYMKMNEFTSMYTKLKYLTTESAEAKHEQTPSAQDNFYKICPAPKPVSPKEPPQYLEMDQKLSMLYDIPPNHIHKSKEKLNQQRHAKHQELHHPIHPLQYPKELLEDKVQVELAEIMNDFKNNVHTIAQTELLVQEWQNRNDVQKSFKEKQEQLKAMRLRYEQIQRDMKNATKKVSPFDRIKKIFSWGSSHHDESLDVGPPQNTLKNDVSISAQRPISSLSLQSTTSSTSSGRMSTISGCSLGDSGTHSDHEDRKNMLNLHEDEFRNDMGRFNYMIPPTPKPINRHGVSSKNNTFATIQERPHNASSKQESNNEDAYYIQFPPNGLPVEVEKHSPSQEYMNFPLGSPKQDDHEYMNFKAP